MKRLAVFILLVFFAGASQVEGAIDVLWYGASSTYNTSFTNLAANAHLYDPNNDGSLAWNLTIWGVSDPTPNFSNYDVLVIGSSYAFGSGQDITRLLAAKAAIEAARGTRTFLSGQDADYHITYGPFQDNGPRGFLINAVNWAGSGTGLGIVCLPDGWQGSGSEWWLNSNSFLRDELLGNVAYFQEESVVIPAATQGYAVNEGLTTAGLSNWGVASHAAYFKSTLEDYISINDAGTHSGYAVTIVTESEASGGTTGAIPEPTTIIIWSLLGALCIGIGRWRCRKAA